MQTIPSEAAVARKFRLERAPTVLAQQEAVAPIAFSRLCSESAFRGRTLAAPPEEAFSFLVALAPMAAGEIWIGGKHSKVPAASPGDIFNFDLAASPVAQLGPTYDILRFYLPAATLDQLAYDRGLRHVGGLRMTSRGTQDPVMHALALSMHAMVKAAAAPPALFVDSIALAFHAHVACTYGGALESGSPGGAGLAPWQLRRAQSYIEAHLDGNPTISDLARECRLSPSHFGRAFRQTVGMPPHRWLTRRRIERAKQLLREGDMQLAQIALACGFGDQSHLTRSFTRRQGCGPGKWRRLHRS
ncbi:MAG: helix-turn-helix transcriptional regulator [Proteobacteria bacterium]|nr:helix-turn-helix transcriptional regulator [Pseudomonadota bacterium]